MCCNRIQDIADCDIGTDVQAQTLRHRESQPLIERRTIFNRPNECACTQTQPRWIRLRLTEISINRFLAQYVDTHTAGGDLETECACALRVRTFWHLARAWRNQCADACTEASLHGSVCPTHFRCGRLDWQRACLMYTLVVCCADV